MVYPRLENKHLEDSALTMSLYLIRLKPGFNIQLSQNDSSDIYSSIWVIDPYFARHSDWCWKEKGKHGQWSLLVWEEKKSDMVKEA